MIFLNSFAGLIPEQDPVKTPSLYLRFPIVFRRLTIGRFPTSWEFIFRNGLAGGRRSEKNHSIQPPFCLFFDRPIFFAIHKFWKTTFCCFLLFAWPKQLPKPANIFNIYIYIQVYDIYKDALSEIGRLFLAAWVCKFRFVYYRETQKIIPKESKRYVFGHLITARSLEVMIFLWCWDILGVILLPNNGNLHRFDPLAFVLDQWKHPWQMLSH